MRRFVVNVLKKFVKPEIIREAEDVTESSVMASQNQLSDEDVFIGYATKQLMKKLEREGDLSPHQRRTFFIGVREFYGATFEYIKSQQQCI